MKVTYISAGQATKRVDMSRNLLAVSDIPLQYVREIVAPKVQAIIKSATEVAQQAADTTIEAFFNWVGHNFMGPDADPEALGITWKPLTDRYTKYKRATGFWIYTGRLQRQFYARSGLKALGKTQATFTNNAQVELRTRTTLGSTINLTFAPNLSGLLASGSSLHGLQTLDVAVFVAAGFDQEMIRKLEGRQSYYRPLVGIALVKYLKEVVPPAIAAALNRAGYKNNTRSSSPSLGAQYGV